MGSNPLPAIPLKACRFFPWLIVIAVAGVYAAGSWIANSGRTAMAYDDAVLELGFEAQKTPDSPHLGGPPFRGFCRPDIYSHLIRAMNGWTGEASRSRRVYMAGLAFLTVTCGYALFRGMGLGFLLALTGAFLLALPRPCIGGEFWGVFDVEDVVARSFFIPPFLLLLLGFVRGIEARAGALWILAPALPIFIHSLSSFYLVGAFALAYIFYHRVSRRAVTQVGLLCLVGIAIGGLFFIAVTGSWPVLLRLLPLSPGIDSREYWSCVKYTFGWAFYPSGVVSQEWWRISLNVAPGVIGLGLAIWADRRARGEGGIRSRESRLLLLMAASCIVMAFLPPAAYEGLCRVLGCQAMFREFFRPLKFIYVTVIWGVLLGFRTLASLPWKREFRLLGIGGLLLLSALPACYESRAVLEKADWAWFMTPSLRYQVLQREPRRRADFEELCVWTRRETDPMSKFCINSSLFRLQARRPILRSNMELFLYANKPGNERAWMDEASRCKVLEQCAEEDRILLAMREGCRYYVKELYMADILRRKGCTLVFANNTYQVFELSCP